jgi:hypothetical protein
LATKSTSAVLKGLTTPTFFNAASKVFGIAYQVNDNGLKALAQYGVDLEAASGETCHLVPVPAVFIVSSVGTIQFEYVNPDYSVRAQPDLLLGAARLVQK